MNESNYRWSHPVTVSSIFSNEQAQRVHALRAAREVIETRKPAGGPFASGGTDANAAYLIEVAQWIVDGRIPSD